MLGEVSLLCSGAGQDSAEAVGHILQDASRSQAMAEARALRFGNYLDGRGAGVCPGYSGELQGTQLALGEDLEHLVAPRVL